MLLVLLSNGDGSGRHGPTPGGGATRGARRAGLPLGGLGSPGQGSKPLRQRGPGQTGWRRGSGPTYWGDVTGRGRPPHSVFGGAGVLALGLGLAALGASGLALVVALVAPPDSGFA